jgi:hypothetical protein
LLGTKRLLSTNHARYVSANFALAAAGQFMVSAGWVTRQIAPQQGRRVASRGPQVPPSGSRRNDARRWPAVPLFLPFSTSSDRRSNSAATADLMKLERVSSGRDGREGVGRELQDPRLWVSQRPATVRTGRKSPENVGFCANFRNVYAQIGPAREALEDRSGAALEAFMALLMLLPLSAAPIGYCAGETSGLPFSTT